MYRTICTQLWTDKKVQRLTVQGKLLFVYLITNPHTHLSGIYYLPQELMRKETGLSDTLCHTLLDTLSKEERAHYDPETSTVFVVNMFEYQGKGPKNEKSAAKQLETLHHTSLIPLFLKRYPAVEPFCPDTLLIPYRYPIPSCPSVPVPSSTKKDLLSSSVPSLKTPDLKSKDRSPKSAATWTAYCAAFLSRYGTEPVRNAKTNSCLSRLVDRLGTEAPGVAAFYCTHDGLIYVRSKHCVDLLLRDAEGLRMEWVTGRQVTNGQAVMTDRTSTTGAIVKKLIAEEEAKHVDRLT